MIAVLFLYSHTHVHFLDYMHACVGFLSPPPILFHLPKAVLYYSDSCCTSATAVLHPAGFWESHRSNDAENSSFLKEHVKLADESSLGKSCVSIWSAQGCQWEGLGLVEGLRLWCPPVLASDPSSVTNCDHGQVEPWFSSSSDWSHQSSP